MQKRVAYQGIAGSFSSIAAHAICGPDIIPLQTRRFREIFEHVTRGEADLGIVAIENALAGSIHENYDLLAEYKCSIVAEYYCPVQLHLMARKGHAPSLQSLSQVYSHPKALEQCSRFLEQHANLSPVSHSDTAGAARYVSALTTSGVAAIASDEAADAYGLEIVARSIQNHSTNLTRFFAVSAQPESESGATKCSLMVTLQHEPASLYKLLGEFATAGVNVTKIESRPIPGRPFEYSFHIDLEETPQSTGRLRAATERATVAASFVRVLGFYSTVRETLQR